MMGAVLQDVRRLGKYSYNKLFIRMPKDVIIHDVPEFITILVY